MTKREWASDVETLIFSDMVYEDFIDGDDDDTLSHIFSNSKRFYKPDESLRNERFKEYSMSIARMDNWRFIRKEGTNGHKNDFDKKSFGDVIEKFQNDDKYLAQDLGADGCYWDGESSGFYAAAFKHNKRDEIMIAYRGTNQNYEDHLMTNALIASGIPSQQFEKAEQFYRRVKANHGTKETKFTFTGHSLGGGLAQWAAVMADGEVDYQCITWNGIGIKDFTYFTGNEFLGYKEGHLNFLKEVTVGNTMMGDIYQHLKEEEVIREYGNDISNISNQYRTEDRLKKEEIKEKVHEILWRIEYRKWYNNLGLEGQQLYSHISDPEVAEKSDNAVVKNKVKQLKEKIEKEDKVNFELLARKMKFIDQYREYKQRVNQASNYTTKEYAHNIITYVNPYDVTGKVLNHVGNCIVVVKNQELKYSDRGIEKELNELIDKKFGENLEAAIQHGFDVFYPYILVEEDGNVGEPKNRYGDPARIGDITNELSYDYLRSIFKTIILDITNNDTDPLKKLYKKNKAMSRSKSDENFQKNLFELCKLALFNSINKQGRKLEEEDAKNDIKILDKDEVKIRKIDKKTFKERLISGAMEGMAWLSAPNQTAMNKVEQGMIELVIKTYDDQKYTFLLDKDNIKYKLDVSILTQLQNMEQKEIEKLWDWESNLEKKKLLLGTEEITSQEKETIYHSIKDKSFHVTNRYQEIEFKIEFEPNKDLLYGSMIDRANQDVVKTDEELFAYQSGYGAKEEYGGNKHPAGAEINLEEEKIGTKIEIKDLSPNNHSSLQYQEKVYGEYSIENGKREEKLRLTYNYYKEKDLLKIIYGKQDELSIIDFKNGDYDIQLPIPLLGVDYEGQTTNPRLIAVDNKLSTALNLKEVRFKGRGKIKINGEYLKALNIKSIGKKDNSKAYQDQAGYQYYKRDNNLYISYKNKEGNQETLCIINFAEGDYGLWIEEEAPYYVEGSNLVAYYDSWNDSQSEVIQLEENKFLEEEDRIKDQFLWIYPEDEIKKPEKETFDSTNRVVLDNAFFNDSEKEEEPEKGKEGSTQVTHSSGNSDFADKKRLITELTKTSSVDKIEQAANIVISEARRKRKPIIAESIEDYLAGMQLKKKIAADKLKTLDAIKIAETELQLKIDEKLIWDLNDIVRYKNLFKSHEEVTFEIKYSRLVNPICRGIEEFVNASEDSILKAKGKFVLEKVLNRNKLSLKGKLTYKWENDYIWRVGRKKLLHSYGFIDDYLFKKLATQGAARPYKMYSKWSYYLSDSLSLVKKDVDTMRNWHWHDFAMFEHI